MAIFRIVMLAFCMCFLVIPIDALKAQSVDEIRNSLTNSEGGKVGWAARLTGQIKADPKCDQPQIWQFSPTGSLDLIRCESGRTTRTQLRYVLRQESNIDVAIRLYGTNAPFAEERRVRVLNEGKRFLIRLVPSSKGALTIDWLFTKPSGG